MDVTVSRKAPTEGKARASEESTIEKPAIIQLDFRQYQIWILFLTISIVQKLNHDTICFRTKIRRRTSFLQRA